MKKEIILIGGGGHCKACIDVIEQDGTFTIAGIVDLPDRIGEKLIGYEIIAADEDLPRLAQEFKYFLVTIGQIKSSSKRAEIYNLLTELGASLPAVVSPRAHVSPHADIGEGTMVMHGAVVNALAFIGPNCIINTQATVEHDVIIGAHSHISTGAIVNGGVLVGDHCFVGSQAMVREGIKIGAHSTVGGGVAVLEDLAPGGFLKKCVS